MHKFIKNISKKTGAAPGTLIHIGEKKSERPVITLIEYNDAGSNRRILSSVSELESLPKIPGMIRWVNIDGLHDIELIASLGNIFNIHPLTLEDIVNTGHRPKAENFENYIYAIIKMLHFQNPGGVIESEQVSLVVLKDLLLSFQEQPTDVFDPIWQRIQKGMGRIRHSGTDYLAYTLLDAVVDHYFQILESFGEELEKLEEALLESPKQELLESIHDLKRDTIYLRKQIWPLRETISMLSHDDASIISEQSRIFFRDIHDHTIQIIEIIESYRDILTGFLDLYMSSVGNKMNEVMKVLTIIATIFIPITFVAGIYGMNFRYMPELNWRWGYAGAWGLMLGIVVTMLLYFKKKNWW